MSVTLERRAQKVVFMYCHLLVTSFWAKFKSLIPWHLLYGEMHCDTGQAVTKLVWMQRRHTIAQQTSGVM